MSLWVTTAVASVMRSLYSVLLEVTVLLNSVLDRLYVQIVTE